MVAYARPISTHHDNVASQLERILEEGPADLDPAIESSTPEDTPLAASSSDTATPEPRRPGAPVLPDLDDLLRGVRREVVYELDELRAQLDAAFDEVVSRVNRLEVRLSALRTATDAQGEATAGLEFTASDTLEVVRRLSITIDEAVAAATDPRPPVHVDTRPLEDATHAGALRNAADIANLARDVEALTAAVQHQDKGIGELRTTLDWIKQRLLS